MSTAIPAHHCLANLLVGAPSLQGAACTGRAPLWDGDLDAPETPQARRERHQKALQLCHRCPVQQACREHRRTHPALGDGVWGAHLFESTPTRSCRYRGCGREFTALAHQRYCSPRCRRLDAAQHPPQPQTHTRLPALSHCQHCGGATHPRAAQEKHAELLPALPPPPLPRRPSKGPRRMTPTAVGDSPPTRTYRLSLPWRRPPLSENQRLNWQAKARITKEVRHTVGWLAKTAAIPACTHCEVRLCWAPNTRRKRDEDNPTPTYKAACDGIVDAGVVPDDEPRYMTKHTPVILPVRKTASVWVEIVITTSPVTGHRGSAPNDVV